MIEEADDEKVEREAVTQLAGLSERRKHGPEQNQNQPQPCDNVAWSDSRAGEQYLLCTAQPSGHNPGTHMSV